MRFGRGARDGRPYGHLDRAGELPTAAGAVGERPNSLVCEPAHGVLYGLPAGAGAEQRRSGDLGDDRPEPVHDGPQNRAVRRGDHVDRFLCEPVDSLRVRGGVVDQRAGVVGQGAQLGNRGAVLGVLRLGDHVEHLQLDSVPQLVDHRL